MKTPHDTPRISARLRRNPETVTSRAEAIAKFAAAIRKGVPDYSDAELLMRATIWADAAIAKGAIVVAP